MRHTTLDKVEHGASREKARPARGAVDQKDDGAGAEAAGDRKQNHSIVSTSCSNWTAWNLYSNCKLQLLCGW